MTIGPLELVVIGFDQPKFQGEVAPKLARLHASGTIRIIDLIFVAKDKNGAVVSTELEQLDDAYRKRYGSMLIDLRGLLTDEDVANVALELPNDTAALIALFEHTWAVALKGKLAEAGGKLLGQVRVPPEVIEELSVELEAAMAG
jgi:hypothetical protein